MPVPRYGHASCKVTKMYRPIISRYTNSLLFPILSPSFTLVIMLCLFSLPLPLCRFFIKSAIHPHLTLIFIESMLSWMKEGEQKIKAHIFSAMVVRISVHALSRSVIWPRLTFARQITPFPPSFSLSHSRSLYFVAQATTSVLSTSGARAKFNVCFRQPKSAPDGAFGDQSSLQDTLSGVSSVIIVHVICWRMLNMVLSSAALFTLCKSTITMFSKCNSDPLEQTETHLHMQYIYFAIDISKYYECLLAACLWRESQDSQVRRSENITRTDNLMTRRK